MAQTQIVNMDDLRQEVRQIAGQQNWTDDQTEAVITAIIDRVSQMTFANGSVDDLTVQVADPLATVRVMAYGVRNGVALRDVWVP